MDNTFTLKHPIVLGKAEPITTLEFRRPKMRDMRLVGRYANSENDVDKIIAMIAACTGLTFEQVEEIDAEDMPALSEACIPFFPQGSEPPSKT